MILSWVGPFSGERPAIKPALLPREGAQFAEDVVFENGALTPRLDHALAATPAKAGQKRAIYRFGKDLASDSQFWFHWLNRTEVCRGPIPDDPNERTYFTEEGQPPKVTDSSIALASTQYPHSAWTLGIPQPTPPTAAVTGTPVGTTAAVELRITYTLVNGYGEEGPPATAPSAGVNWQPGQTLTVSNLQSGADGAYNIVGKRIYVAILDSTGAQRFKLWTLPGTLPLAQASFSAVFDSTNLQDSLAEPYLLPARTDLHSIGAHPGKFLFGFSGKRFCRSEVERPYGWPDEYEDPVEHDIVGGAIVGSTVVVCSKVWTYRFTGSDPLAQIPERLEGFRQPCVSRESIVSAEGRGVLYASPDGLVMVPPAGSAEVITRKLITPKQWRLFKPDSMRAAWHDGKYIVSYDTGAVQGTLIIDLDDGTLTRSSVYFRAAYVDPRENSLFLLIGDEIRKWEAAAGRRTMTFTGKELLRPDLLPFCAAKVVADAYPVTFQLLTRTGDAAYTVRHTQAVLTQEPFSLPSGYSARALFWRVVTSLGDVTEVHLADAIEDFAEIQT